MKKPKQAIGSSTRKEMIWTHLHACSNDFLLQRTAYKICPPSRDSTGSKLKKPINKLVDAANKKIC